MPENTNRKKHKSKIIVGILVCVFILAYLIYQLGTYFFSSSISLYQVGEGSSESKYENQYTALILRQEEVVYSSDSGYINFLVGDSTPVSVNEETYLIDESGTLYEQLSSAVSSSQITDGIDLSDIKNTIYEFDITFDEDNYYDIYSFKYKLESQLFDVVYSNAFEASYADLSSYTIQTSEYSGILMHTIDGFEDVDADDMEASYFRQSNYSRDIITSNDYVESGDAVCKIITSQQWQLVIQIEDSSVFEDVSSVEIEFLKDSVTATCDFYMYTTAGFTYGVLTLDKYMYRYVSDRYISISITDADVVSGLIIPKSSVVTKQFYLIPVSYLTTGGNSSSKGFLVQSGSEIQFVVPDIVKTTDEYVYVSVDFLDEGDILVETDTNETYEVKIKENVEGVYVSESGSYSFEAVDIIGENSDYYIIDEDTSSISLYDNIVIDADSVAD